MGTLAVDVGIRRSDAATLSGGTPFALDRERTTAMGDKSPKKTSSKEPARTLKEKRAVKVAKRRTKGVATL